MQPTEIPNNLDHLNQAQLLDILDWYVTSGVDEAVGDVATNHFEPMQTANLTFPTQQQSRQNTPKTKTNKPALSDGLHENPKAKAPLKPIITATKPTIATPSPHANKQRLATDMRAGHVNYDESIKTAQNIAKNSGDLKALQKAVAAFEGCNLKFIAKHLIFGQGNENAKIMIVGESPGRDEDLVGHAFAGSNGNMLDQILKSIGFARDDVWLSYLIPWRSAGGVAPNAVNIDICKPFLLRQIELVNPTIIILFDGLVSKVLTEQNASIINLRGKFSSINIGDKNYDAMPTYHPQLLLSNGTYKQAVWHDFLSAKSKLG